MTISDPSIGALEAMDRRELEEFKNAVEAGVVVAVPAALYFCSEHGVSVPQWLAKAASELLCDLLKREKSTKRGRSGGAVARYRQDLIDMTRWNEVIVIREKQQQVRHEIEYYSNSSMRMSSEQIARAGWLGRSLSRAFECVSDVFERTEAFGSPESIKRSYREVARNMGDPSQAQRYSIFHPLFLQMLGIDDDLGYGRRVKMMPWRTQGGGPKCCSTDRQAPTPR
jgi:hypothetical protein